MSLFSYCSIKRPTSSVATWHQCKKKKEGTSGFIIHLGHFIGPHTGPGIIVMLSMDHCYLRTKVLRKILNLLQYSITHIMQPLLFFPELCWQPSCQSEFVSTKMCSGKCIWWMQDGITLHHRQIFPSEFLSMLSSHCAKQNAQCHL